MTLPQNTQDFEMNEAQKQTAKFLFITALDNLKWYRKKFFKKLNYNEITFEDFSESWKNATTEEKEEFLEDNLLFDYDSKLINYINLFNIYQATDEKLSIKQRTQKALQLFKEMEQK